jgi:hypothetical protein
VDGLVAGAVYPFSGCSLTLNKFGWDEVGGSEGGPQGHPWRDGSIARVWDLEPPTTVTNRCGVRLSPSDADILDS